LSDLAVLSRASLFQNTFAASWMLFYGKYGATVELKLEHPLKSEQQGACSDCNLPMTSSGKANVAFPALCAVYFSLIAEVRVNK
jgi:hypothetical protein